MRRDASPAPPPRGRRFVVDALIALVIGGSLMCIVLDRELWPFSNYPMFSELARGRHHVARLYGVVGGVEVPLLDHAYWYPLDASRVARAVQRLALTGPSTEPAVAALRDLAARYEERRVHGAHAGPRLSGLRAYGLTWNVRSGAVNRAGPDARLLLAEYLPDAPR